MGVIVFDGPQGHGFYKGGHDGQTANTLVCIESRQRCVVILSNDVRSDAGFADLVRLILGDTGVPYDWEYANYAGKLLNRIGADVTRLALRLTNAGLRD